MEHFLIVIFAVSTAVAITQYIINIVLAIKDETAEFMPSIILTIMSITSYIYMIKYD